MGLRYMDKLVFGWYSTTKKERKRDSVELSCISGEFNRRAEIERHERRELFCIQVLATSRLTILVLIHTLTFTSSIPGKSFC